MLCTDAMWSLQQAPAPKFRDALDCCSFADGWSCCTTASSLHMCCKPLQRSLLPQARRQGCAAVLQCCSALHSAQAVAVPASIKAAAAPQLTIWACCHSCKPSMLYGWQHAQGLTRCQGLTSISNAVMMRSAQAAHAVAS